VAISAPEATEPILLDDPALFVALYRRMVLIRRFEDSVQSLFT